MWGNVNLPERWLAKLELRALLETVNSDVHDHLSDPHRSPNYEDDCEKYPGSRAALGNFVNHFPTS